MTQLPRQQWIVTADTRRASLFSCRKTPGGEVHLDLAKSLQNPHEKDHERHRPSQLGGAERRGSTTSSSASAAPHTASFGHEVEEEHRRFARDVTAWLAQDLKEVNANHITVFAPPQFLGLLRNELGKAPAPGAHVDLREGELTHLRTSELAGHPAVLAVMKEPLGTKTKK